MAYRKVDAQVPSFLDAFLEQIAALPAHVKAKFAELRELDDRAQSLMSDAERAAADVMRRHAAAPSGAAGGGAGGDPLRRVFADVLALQGRAADAAARKVELADAAYVLIEETISGLDGRLREYEAQLKREGRWPAAANVKNDCAVARRSSGGRSPKVVKEEVALGVAPPVGKARKRDRERERLLKERAREKARAREEAAARAEAEAARVKEEAAKEEAAAAVAASGMVVVEDAGIDPNEPRYCLCNQVSYGNMVGCEGKSCQYEWFHYQCVGITTAPVGKWYCPECKARREKKARK